MNAQLSLNEIKDLIAVLNSAMQRIEDRGQLQYKGFRADYVRYENLTHKLNEIDCSVEESGREVGD